MKGQFEPFEAFFNKYESFERETVDDIINRYSTSDQEKRHTISSLIDTHQQQRDVELELLSKKTKKLLKQLQGIEIQRMLEELQCFKDIIALQKRLGDTNSKSSN